jgi:hypothetical protein
MTLMKPLILSALALVLTLTGAEAQAKNIDVTHKVLTRIQSIEGGLENLRVYVSRTLLIERSTANADRVLHEKVKKGTRGKIIAIEGSEVSVDHGYGNAPNSIRIYVSFDASCETNPHNCSVSRLFGSESYYLSQVPENADFSSVRLYSQKLLQKRQLDKHDTRNAYMAYRNDLIDPISEWSVRLQIDTDELYRVIIGSGGQDNRTIKESKHHVGW